MCDFIRVTLRSEDFARPSPRTLKEILCATVEILEYSEHIMTYSKARQKAEFEMRDLIYTKAKQHTLQLLTFKIIKRYVHQSLSTS